MSLILMDAERYCPLFCRCFCAVAELFLELKTLYTIKVLGPALQLIGGPDLLVCPTIDFPMGWV